MGLLPLALNSGNMAKDYSRPIVHRFMYQCREWLLVDWLREEPFAPPRNSSRGPVYTAQGIVQNN